MIIMGFFGVNIDKVILNRCLVSKNCNNYERYERVLYRNFFFSNGVILVIFFFLYNYGK